MSRGAGQRGLARDGSYDDGARVGWSGPSLPTRSDVPKYYLGLERALIDSFSREALASAMPYVNDPRVHAIAFLRARGGKGTAVPYASDDWIVSSSPIYQWYDRLARDPREKAYEFAAIVGFDRQDRKPFVNAYVLSPAIVGPLREVEESR